MNFLRNPEIKKSVILLAALSLTLSLCGIFISMRCAVYVFFCCAVLFLFYTVTTKKRYDRISALTEEITNILHNGNVMLIDNFNEGELSIIAGEVKKLFGKLYEQNENLKKEKLLLSDSLADISHQLRTPLTSINIVLSLLGASDITDERRFELVSELASLLSVTDRLVTMLLKIARIDASAVPFRKKEVKVYDCVKNAVSVIEIALEIKCQKLELNIKDETFLGDIEWTSEAVGNILKNCIEHTPENGTIKIEAEETPIYTKIRISDTGEGISENDLPHLFERFYKGSNSSKNSFGIGLNLAYLIVSNQDGILKAYNENGSACFEIKFYKTVV